MKNKHSRWIIPTIFILFMLIVRHAFAVDAMKGGDAKVDVQVITKEIGGPVAYVDPSNISVTYAQKADSEYDMFLPFNEKQKLGGYKSIPEIVRGDIVKIIYDEMTTAKNTPGMRVERKIKEIHFVKRPSETDAMLSSGGSSE